MDKITIYDKENRIIQKDNMSLFVKIVYEKANKAAYSLSHNYKRQNQRIEICIDENTGNYNMRFFKCTAKYAYDFKSLFRQKLKHNY